MKTTFKIEVTFTDKKRAEQFKGDMLNLEYYGIKMSNIYESNEPDYTLKISAEEMDNDVVLIGGDFHNNVPHLNYKIGAEPIRDRCIDLTPTPETDYPDGDDG